MSVLGILAKGGAAAVKGGGDVLAKGEEDKRGQIYWDMRTETARKNNLEAIRVRSDETRESGWVNKSGGKLNVREENQLKNQARKAGISVEELAKQRGLSTSGEYAGKVTREKAMAEADADFDAKLKSPEGKAWGLSKDQIPNVRAQWRDAYTQSLRAGKGSKLTADQFVTHFVANRKSIVEDISAREGGVKLAKKEQNFTGSDDAFYDKMATDSVMRAQGASQIGRGLTPTQQTSFDVGSEQMTAQVAADFNTLKTPQEVKEKMEVEMAAAKTQAAKAIIQRVGEERLAALGGAPAQPIEQPSVLSGGGGPPDMMMSAHTPTGKTLYTPADVGRAAKREFQAAESAVDPSILNRIQER